MMKKTKEIYSQPTTKLLVVRVEGVIMGSPYGAKGAAGALMEDDDDYSYSL